MKIIPIISAALLSASLSISCQQEMDFWKDSLREEGVQPIVFRARSSNLDYEISTRSSIDATISDLCSEGFGVFAYNTGDNGFAGASNHTAAVSNAQLTSSNGGATWDYSGTPATWNTASSDKYSFFAYFPYSEEMSSPVLDFGWDAYDGQMMVSDCSDILAARPVLNQTSKEGVTLEFEHIFSKISPEVKLTKSSPGYAYGLELMALGTVQQHQSYDLTSGRFSGDSPEPLWIYATEEHFSKDYISSTSESLVVSPFLICPHEYQSRSEEIMLSFVFNVYKDNGATYSNQVAKTISISKDFLKNTHYRLSIHFTPDEEEISISVNVQDYREDNTFSLVLSNNGTANSYIVPTSGRYSFDARFKGNSRTESVGTISSAEVLWESYGRQEAPEVGALVKDVRYEDGFISFSASGKKGNALIGARDAGGNILWSWHIWLTDIPDDQIYRNFAGTVMDRNLGATSDMASDGTSTYGLFYQWGRKDPFLGDAGYGSAGTALATYTHEAIAGGVEAGMDIQNPTTFYKNWGDWLSPSDDTRWDSNGDDSGGKTIHDPCPPGYRVPSIDMWKIGFGTNKTRPEYTEGYDFGKDESYMSLTDEPTCWFPASHMINFSSGEVNESSGYYWSRTPYNNVQGSYFFIRDDVSPTYTSMLKSSGFSVRCAREEAEVTNLSGKGVANCYIVPKAGRYLFTATQGNSGVVMDEIVSASVLWESFGTDERVSSGDLINMLSHSGATISFTATERKGNAVIIAENADGKIWSWHIWLTDIPKNQTYKNNAGTAMDRNLGATSARKEDGVKTLGLLYQWGRKDPFPGVDSPTSTTAAATAMLYGHSFRDVDVEDDASYGTVQFSVENPTAYIYDNYGWLTETDHTLWGATKTMYDPCPPGYRVPSGGSDGFWAKAAGITESDSAAPFNETYYGLDFAGSGTGYFSSSVASCWYPAVGFYVNGYGYAGSGAFYWSSTAKEDDGYAYLLSCGTDEISVNYNIAPVFAAAVRCVKE